MPHAAPLRIAAIEPFFGGSHKAFLQGYRKFSRHRIDLFTLPARKWKWRMRLSGPYYADKLSELDREFDLIICSTFVDVAAFRGLAPAWVRNVPLLEHTLDALRRSKMNRTALLVGVRLDHLLKFRPALERLLKKIRRTRQSIHCYTIGSENFSDEELLRFNKGFDLLTAKLDNGFIKRTVSEWNVDSTISIMKTLMCNVPKGPSVF